MTQRTQSRLALEEAVTRDDYVAARVALFRVLYGAFLSSSLQVCNQALGRAARAVDGGRSPWIAELLEDPIAWATQRGRVMGPLPAEETPAQVALRTSLEALITATDFLHDSAVVARAFCVAIAAGIEAQADMHVGNEAEARAVRKREWLAIAQDLRQEHLADVPDADPNAVEAALGAWRIDEYLLRLSTPA
ncbi:MAG: hypothetical protein K0R38_2483 [Polyangiaceae bacterium]|jgi:hypothetical protein|nr:hypothetical protein [Polyangiaceae bacterium]